MTATGTRPGRGGLVVALVALLTAATAGLLDAGARHRTGRLGDDVAVRATVVRAGAVGAVGAGGAVVRNGAVVGVGSAGAVVSSAVGSLVGLGGGATASSASSPVGSQVGSGWARRRLRSRLRGRVRGRARRSGVVGSDGRVRRAASSGTVGVSVVVGDGLSVLVGVVGVPVGSITVWVTASATVSVVCAATSVVATNVAATTSTLTVSGDATSGAFLPPRHEPPG